MLSDQQINELEWLLLSCPPEQLDQVVSKVTPILFAELRIQRGILGSRINSFLGEFDATNTEEKTGESDASVSQGSDADRSETPDEGGVGVHGTEKDTRATDGKKKVARRNRSKPSRTNRKKRSNKKKLDAGASKPKVGGKAKPPKAGEAEGSKQNVDISFDDIEVGGTNVSAG